jgi:hypothetical protein
MNAIREKLIKAGNVEPVPPPPKGKPDPRAVLARKKEAPTKPADGNA